ncbi:Na/Pi symporter [Candidatus Albibeggiatoa sp. nov. NOAA]|uniref:Na/Pi symporter n=1 Tax=Candidatus Albibeggiatoa sp. nov. NOAA TaxID=3162724 RepID=UPI0032F4F7DC|nr:Na/Pi symporter [Thiotrichaceae bacterium]
MVYVLLVAVGMIGSGFKLASGGKEGAEKLFAFATNPFLGLIIGTMATALVQSSSTVTSVIVGLVAGGLPVATAVPMVMGANIGTTITNTLVSLGHAREKEEFKRAFSAATVHDFFNLLSVIVFLPLEIAFGFLEKTGLFLAQMLMGGESLAIGQFNFMKAITKPVINVVKDLVHDMPTVAAGTVMVVAGILLIFISITYIGKLLKKAMVGRAKTILHAAIGRGPISGITSGTLVTVLVQSSSTTTSLAVPLAGSGVFTTRDIYPFTLGANIGTCITALLAATAITGATAVFALQIALVHLVYNLLGVIIIYGIPFLRDIPLKGAAKLADFASEYKAAAVAYILGVFFLIPGAFVFISSSVVG